MNKNGIVTTANGKQLNMALLKERNKNVRPITNVKKVGSTSKESDTTTIKKTQVAAKLNLPSPKNAPVSQPEDLNSTTNKKGKK